MTREQTERLERANRRLLRHGVRPIELPRPVKPLPDWLPAARERSANAQRLRIDLDDALIQSARWFREQEPKWQKLGLSVDPHPIPVSALERKLRRYADDLGDPAVPFYEKRIAELARQFNVRVFIGATCFAGTSWSGARAVDIPPLRSAASFAVGLHELGHIGTAKDAAQDRQIPHPAKPHVVVCPLGEVKAWQWAIANCGTTWTRAMQSELQRCLSTYLKYATESEVRVMRRLIARTV